MSPSALGRSAGPTLWRGEGRLADLQNRPGTELFVSLSVHRPRAGFTDHVVGLMHWYGDAARTQPGLVEVKTLRSEDGEVLVGYVVWQSAAAVEHDFELWEEGVEGWELSTI